LSKKSPLFLPTFVLKTLICVRQIWNRKEFFKNSDM
jgi:hypothetical protein